MYNNRPQTLLSRCQKATVGFRVCRSTLDILDEPLFCLIHFHLKIYLTDWNVEVIELCLGFLSLFDFELGTLSVTRTIIFITAPDDIQIMLMFGYVPQGMLYYCRYKSRAMLSARIRRHMTSPILLLAHLILPS